MLSIGCIFVNCYNECFVRSIRRFDYYTYFYTCIRFVYSYGSAFVEILQKNGYNVKFDGDNVLLVTNKEIHSINNKHIVQVKEDFSTCITYIKYDDGIVKKDFKYQMKYFPFKTNRLNIDEMKKYMPYTEFI